jgi:hypothetical protein
MLFVFYLLLILSDVASLLGVSMFRKINLVLLVLFPMVCLSQKTEYYSYGYEGIERIYRKKDSVILFSNSKARPYVKDAVIDTLIKRHQRGKIKSGEIVIQLNDAKVFGFIEIINGKEKSKSINIIYQKVEYKNGLIEIYRKPQKK